MPEMQSRRDSIHAASGPAIDLLYDANRFPFALPEP